MEKTEEARTRELAHALDPEPGSPFPFVQPERADYFPGEVIRIGHRRFLVPTLPMRIYVLEQGFERVAKIMKAFQSFQGMATTGELNVDPEVIKDTMTLTLAAIRRNYPGFTDEQFLDEADFDAVIEIMPNLIAKNDRAALVKRMGENPTSAGAGQRNGKK